MTAETPITMLAHPQLIVDAPGDRRDPVRPSDAALRAQIRDVGEAQRAAQDGISLAQTAEPTLTEVHALLQLARDHADAAGGATAGARPTAIGDDLAELAAELAAIARTGLPHPGLPDATTARPSSDGPGGDGTGAIATTLADVASAVAAAAAPPADGAAAAVDRAITAVAGARAAVRAARDRLLDRMDTLAVRQAAMAALAEQLRAG